MNRKAVAALAGGGMIALAAVIYLLQYLLFKRPADSEFYFFQDLAFLPINVLLVTVGVNAFLSYREKREKLNKINILIGEFFTESGFDAIRLLNAYVVNVAEVSACASSDSACSTRDTKQFIKRMLNLRLEIDPARGSLTELRDCLVAMKPQFLAMFENPNLIEHDRFTDMLWALYHLMDELRSRESLTGLPPADLKHLSGDILRAYALLIVEWAAILRHMREKYPYLYSLANRKNPFLQTDVVIRE